MKKTYIIACRTPWFWDEWKAPVGEDIWVEIREPDQLQLKLVEELNPRFIFFPHWSNIVSESITSKYECVCFHATPVPFGRGGSPVQNMILLGKEETTVSALRMMKELDAGPVYARSKVSLLGGGDEVFIRMSRQVQEMILQISREEPKPTEQSGEVTLFKRRTPAQSRIPNDSDLSKWFDYIRMLDAEGYPRAFVQIGEARLEFSRPALRRGRIEASVTISVVKGGNAT